jgi:hypothetical protein
MVDGQPWSREFGPRRYAEDFLTREEAEAEIGAMRGRFPDSLMFELVHEQTLASARA